MRQAVPQILQSLDAGRPVAYCRLVETSGSTPQKAGAVMLIYPDGSQHGTLGGGCVEAEVKRRALGVLELGQPSVAEFQLDHDYGWDDGLICGGRMTVAIFALVDDACRSYFASFELALSAGQGVMEALVFGTDDPQANSEKEASRDSPSSSQVESHFAPRSYLFDAEGECIASMEVCGESDFAAEVARVTGVMPNLSDRPRPKVRTGIAFLPVLPRCRLIIVGAGHIGQAVAELATSLDFDVSVVDDRAECATRERFPHVSERVVGPMAEVLPALEVTPTTYCLIVTRGHNHDQEALFHVVQRPARYIGLIGSRRKIKLIFDNLVAEGISPASLKKVYAPIGIDIGSQTVAEIAVSVAAELVAHRNLGSVPGRPQSIPVQEDEGNN